MVIFIYLINRLLTYSYKVLLYVAKEKMGWGIVRWKCIELNDDNLDDVFNNAIESKTLIKNRKTLSIDYVPERLPFRDNESTMIAQTLSVILRGGRPSNLLIFGKPGTGKTAVVKNVIERLKNKADNLDMQITVPFMNAKTD